jgi:hypothetical protein
MVNIRRAAQVDSKEVQKQLEQMELVEALRHGNIYEVLSKSKNFKVSDFFTFFSKQHKLYKSNIIQDTAVKSEWASGRQANIKDFAKHHRGVQVSNEAGTDFLKAMMGSLGRGSMGTGTGAGKFKATTAEAGEAAPMPEGEASLVELQGMTEGTLGEWDQFMEDSWGQIFDAQMMQDYEQRMGEIKQEVQRIITLCKEGKLGPEFVLIALAKVNATKNGCLMTWMGKKAFHINESLGNIANDLSETSVMDPGYNAQLTLGREQSRDGAMQLNLLMSDMQKVMQDIASVMESVHSMMGEMNRTRREIITKVAAN